VFELRGAPLSAWIHLLKAESDKLSPAAKGFILPHGVAQSEFICRWEFKIKSKKPLAKSNR